ncbi:MAG: type II toxin-antitoxin system Phd/YefM family antitoxin [Phycisphaerales bacterium]|nr:type II toxin-antitoxin system Phd/YefM family antitoxin [Phycisphaerales bacterium]
MTTISAKKARANFSEVIDQVRAHGKRVLVQRNGRDAAALVSVEDLRLLELLEDRRDIRAAKKALAEEARVSWESVKARLALD